MSDRITTLSDPILIRIVSYLPINNAASTSILSKRWQYVWTRTTSLRITLKSPSSDNFRYYRTLLHCATQLCWDNLDTIQLNFISYSGGNDKVNNMCTAVIRDIISGQNIKAIKIQFNGNYYRSENSKYVTLPSHIFDMPLLHTLELLYRFELELPKNGVINWPCLTKLDIHVTCSQFGLLGNIVTQCNLLEELTIHAWLEYAKSCFNLCSESLRRLYIEIERGISYHENNRLEIPVLRILSDAPMLQDVDYKGQNDFSIRLSRNISCLV